MLLRKSGLRFRRPLYFFEFNSTSAAYYMVEGPVIFNKYFNARIPLQKDSCILMRYECSMQHFKTPEMKPQYKSSLWYRGWYCFLLPVFFVLHGYNENFYFIGIRDVLLLVVIYVTATITVYLLCFLFCRNWLKASLLTFYLMSFFLFYGALKDFLKLQLPFASRPSARGAPASGSAPSQD